MRTGETVGFRYLHSQNRNPRGFTERQKRAGRSNANPLCVFLQGNLNSIPPTKLVFCVALVAKAPLPCAEDQYIAVIVRTLHLGHGPASGESSRHTRGIDTRPCRDAIAVCNRDELAFHIPPQHIRESGGMGPVAGEAGYLVGSSWTSKLGTIVFRMPTEDGVVASVLSERHERCVRPLIGLVARKNARHDTGADVHRIVSRSTANGAAQGPIDRVFLRTQAYVKRPMAGAAPGTP